MLTSQEQQVWDDVQRFWELEAEEPARLAPPAPGRMWGWLDEEDLPVAVVAGIWITIALVLFGAVLAGLAVAAATAVGWALWRNWPRSIGQGRPADEVGTAD